MVRLCRVAFRFETANERWRWYRISVGMDEPDPSWNWQDEMQYWQAEPAPENPTEQLLGPKPPPYGSRSAIQLYADLKRDMSLTLNRIKKMPSSDPYIRMIYISIEEVGESYKSFKDEDMLVAKLSAENAKYGFETILKVFDDDNDHPLAIAFKKTVKMLDELIYVLDNVDKNNNDVQI